MRWDPWQQNATIKITCTANTHLCVVLIVPHPTQHQSPRLDKSIVQGVPGADYAMHHCLVLTCSSVPYIPVSRNITDTYMSKRHDVESVVASVNGLEKVIVSTVSTTKHLQLILPDNTKPQQNVIKNRRHRAIFTLYHGTVYTSMSDKMSI